MKKSYALWLPLVGAGILMGMSSFAQDQQCTPTAEVDQFCHAIKVSVKAGVSTQVLGHKSGGSLDLDLQGKDFNPDTVGAIFPSLHVQAGDLNSDIDVKLGYLKWERVQRPNIKYDYSALGFMNLGNHDYNISFGAGTAYINKFRGRDISSDPDYVGTGPLRQNYADDFVFEFSKRMNDSLKISAKVIDGGRFLEKGNQLRDYTLGAEYRLPNSTVSLGAAVSNTQIKMVNQDTGESKSDGETLVSFSVNKAF